MDEGRAPRTACLVACVSKKARGPRPARELYRSAWFLKARAWVEARGEPWLARRWCFRPEEVAGRPLLELADALRSYRVSQRHGQDTAAWRMLGEALLRTDDCPEVLRAIHEGVGDARALLAALARTTAAGTPLFPLLGGPKIGPMWVRMLAWPGGADISSIEVIPVAVDVQVRRVTENLGLTATRGQELDRIRGEIQAAWRANVQEHGAAGPAAIAGTSAAIDPALWFIGKWGCSFCERAGRKLRIADFCQHCRLLEKPA